jgi:plasmid stability protein
MAQLIVRNLAEDVVKALKQIAAADPGQLQADAHLP